MKFRATRYCAAALTGVIFAGCGGALNGGPTSGITMAARHGRPLTASSPITHVIIIVQENRSFDNLFATFPGADGATTGRKGKHTVPLEKHTLVESCDFGHSRKGFVAAYDHGQMDGFNAEGNGKCTGKKSGIKPYQYVDPAQIVPYWYMAQQYVLADHMFQTQGSGSFTAHQDLIRGNSAIDQAQTQSLVDVPTGEPWGCDAPGGTLTSLLVSNGNKLFYQRNVGPFPCSKNFPSSGSAYLTLRDLLDAQGLSWKYYSPPVFGGAAGGLWNAFDVIAPVRYGPEWQSNVTQSEKRIFADITAGSLPNVSWVIPQEPNSDHPGANSDTGPSWVANVVNAVGQSQYWPSTAIIVVWDDWGGFYDHEPPPFLDQWGGLGFRVPMLLVSPYAREAAPSTPGYISHTQYEFGSILRFIEDNWSLGQLGTSDGRATSMVDCFDFTQAPRTFQMIPSSHSRDYFLRQPPSNKPVDSE